MSASPENTPPAGDLPGSADDTPSLVHIAWRALTAPLTGAILVVSLAIVWLSALIVPQGAATAELLALFPYAQAQAIRSLGLQDVVTSWPSLFFMMLLLLHAVGLFVEASSRKAGSTAAREQGGGRWSHQASATMSRPLDELLTALGKGEHGSFYRDARAPRVWRGLWREGLALVAVGIGVLLISIPVDRTLGLEARVTLSAVPGESMSTPVSTMVRDFRGWVDGETPIQLACQDPDPADALRRRSCVLQAGGEPVSITLVAGSTLEQSPISLSPLEETPRRQAGRTSLLLTREGEGPRVLRGEPGRTYELADQTRLTTFEGPDGPLVVARAGADGRPRLLAPGGGGADTLAGRSVAGVPGWLFDVAVEADPGRPLRVAGGALLIIGLLLMVLVPHLEVRLVPSGDTVLAIARSNNRSSLAIDWCAALNADGGTS